jgi:hypothetical protein
VLRTWAPCGHTPKQTFLQQVKHTGLLVEQRCERPEPGRGLCTASVPGYSQVHTCSKRRNMTSKWRTLDLLHTTGLDVHVGGAGQCT